MFAKKKKKSKPFISYKIMLGEKYLPKNSKTKPCFNKKEESNDVKVFAEISSKFL